MTDNQVCVTVQSHNWGRDVHSGKYDPKCGYPCKVLAVYRNMVTGYCGGGDDPAVGQVAECTEDLVKLIGYPSGYEHCRVQFVVAPHQWNYEAPDICATCGGKCCERMPGSMTPDDCINLTGKNLFAAVKALFKSGNFVMDSWEGDPRGLDYDDDDYMYGVDYVRPRGKGDRGLVQATWGWGNNTCILLTPTGCSLQPFQRPTACRHLEPKPRNEKCIGHTDKRAVALTWIPYQDAIAHALNVVGR